MALSASIDSINSWDDFLVFQAAHDPQARGAAFELLVRHYLQFDPAYRTKLHNVWLLADVPEAIRVRLNLPRPDEGIERVDLFVRSIDRRHRVEDPVVAAGRHDAAAKFDHAATGTWYTEFQFHLVDIIVDDGIGFGGDGLLLLAVNHIRHVDGGRACQRCVDRAAHAEGFGQHGGFFDSRAVNVHGDVEGAHTGVDGSPGNATWVEFTLYSGGEIVGLDRLLDTNGLVDVHAASDERRQHAVERVHFLVGAVDGRH